MNNELMHDSILECWECRTYCQKTLFNHCLIEGEQHAEINHVKLMIDCIQICQLAADFMVRNSERHYAICRTCAEVCEACAKSCENIDDKKMKECAKICRKCAKSCSKMAKMK
jgi:ketopantoate reductase